MRTGHPATFSKFKLLARLGSGGMAEVYLVLAEGPSGFSKLQVLKLMRSDLTEQERPGLLDMFQDEARLAARLNHPNIVQSHEVGTEDGQPFIAMEFLEGQPLSRVQQRARKLGDGFPLEMELLVLTQVLEGLDYAHRFTDYDGSPLHIVHRDVSPQNVFITYSGHTKLLDFGVAKTLESSTTRAGEVKGKVAYMPPEQVTSGPIDHRADLFSVGVLLWEAIAGRRMYADLSVYESVERLVRGSLPKLRDAAPEVSGELERIVERALQLDPELRYPDADAFRHDLLGYLESSSKVRARDVGVCVAKLFAQERSELAEVIRQAVTQPSDPTRSPSGVTRRVAASAAPGSPDPLPTVAAASAPSLVDKAVTLASAPDPAPPAPSQATSAPGRRRTWRWSALSLGLILAVVAVVALRAQSSGARGPSSRVTSASAPQQAPGSLAPQTEIELVLQVEPQHASIVLDGRALGSAPYRARQPRDELEHSVVASAPGFVSQSQILRFASDVFLQLRLQPSFASDVSSERPPAPTDRRRTHPRAFFRSRAEEPRASTPAAKPSALKPSESLPSELAEPEPYRDLPAPTRRRAVAPVLDTSDPWAPEPAR